MTAKPPVFYFLTQVRFNRVTQMEQYVPAFQEALRRDGFADFNEEVQLEVAWQQSGSAQPEIQQLHRKRWLFNDMNKQSGFVLQDDALVFHTTAYTCFSDCKAAVMGALQKLDAEVGLNFTQRVGMRYLDRVLVADFSQLNDLLHPGLLGLAGDVTGNLRHSFSETVSVVDGLTLVLKSFVSPSGLMLPPDLQGITLALPDEFVGNRSPQVVIDSDCYVEKRFAFEMATIEEHLDRLHDQLLGLFEQATTQEARQLWQV